MRSEPDDMFEPDDLWAMCGNSDAQSESVQRVLRLKFEHRFTWRARPDWYWLAGLLEEVCELVLALIGLHRHAPELELAEIASIAMNWLEKRSEPTS